MSPYASRGPLFLPSWGVRTSPPAEPGAARATAPRPGPPLNSSSQDAPEGQSCASRPPSGTEAGQARAAGQTHRPRPRRSSDAQPASLEGPVSGRRCLRLSAVAHYCQPFACPSHGVNGTWPGPACPGSCSSCSLGLGPAREALPQGPKLQRAPESVSAAAVGLHPRFTPTEVDSLGAAGGLRGRQGSTGHTRTLGLRDLHGANPSPARHQCRRKVGHTRQMAQRPHQASQVGALGVRFGARSGLRPSDRSRPLGLGETP